MLSRCGNQTQAGPDQLPALVGAAMEDRPGHRPEFFRLSFTLRRRDR